MMKAQRLFKQHCIAITGSIASGKSTVASMIRANGYPVIDADELARIAVAPGSEGLNRVISEFGNHMIRKDGQLDRKKMRQIVFNNPDARLKLENIIHPYLETLAMETLISQGYDKNPGLWFYEASLIYEKSLQNRFKAVWVCYCEKQLQVERLMLRDRIGEKEAEQTLKNQMSGEEKVKLADYVIDTGCDLKTLETMVHDAIKSVEKE